MRYGGVSAVCVTHSNYFNISSYISLIRIDPTNSIIHHTIPIINHQFSPTVYVDDHQLFCDTIMELQTKLNIVFFPFLLLIVPPICDTIHLFLDLAAIFAAWMLFLLHLISA